MCMAFEACGPLTFVLRHLHRLLWRGSTKHQILVVALNVNKADQFPMLFASVTEPSGASDPMKCWRSAGSCWTPALSGYLAMQRMGPAPRKEHLPSRECP